MKTHALRPNLVLLPGLCLSFCLSLLFFGDHVMARPAGASGIPSPTMEVRHPVGPGEDLHLLAAYYYGDARQWKKIYQANRNRIKNPNRIYPKQILRVEVPIDWKPPMPFSAWMATVEQSAPSQGVSSPAKEKPSAERSGEEQTSGSR